jgi:Ni/Fe-hydrogenase subunit HybB-like protein
MAPRFLASAFAAGPALLILLCLIIRKLTKFDVGREPIQKLALIVTYAMILTVFFFLLELFTTFYSRIPEDMVHFEYLLAGLQGHHALVPWMWSFIILAAVSLTLLILPRTRHNENILAATCGMVFVSLWIEKGICQVIGGFIPSPLGNITEYAPTLPEVAIVVGIWAVGILMTTVFYKIALSVREGYDVAY